MDSTIIATIVGSITTSIGLGLNYLFLYKKEKAKLIHSEKIIEKQNGFEIEKEYINRKVNEIKEAHLLLSWFESEYTITSSIIDFNSSLSDIEYHKKYKEDLSKLILLKYYMDFYYPELHERIEYLDDYLNQYWKCNQAILKNRESDDKSTLEELVRQISEIEILILGQIKTIKKFIISKDSN